MKDVENLSVKNRVGQIWEKKDGFNVELYVLFLVVKAAIKRGSDHHNPYAVMWTHVCLNLETSESFEAREWSDESWEDRASMTRLS